MDYNAELYNQGAADIIGPAQQLINQIRQHFDVQLKNGYLIFVSNFFWLTNYV